MEPEPRTMTFRFVLGIILIFLAFGFPYLITHTDYIEVQVEKQHENWLENHISKFMHRHPTAKKIETKNQIIVESGSELEDVLVIYKGHKPPIIIKEENIVNRTGIQVQVITPNDVSTFITQR
mgnify:CR=1 FL=1